MLIFHIRNLLLIIIIMIIIIFNQLSLFTVFRLTWDCSSSYLQLARQFQVNWQTDRQTDKLNWVSSTISQSIGPFKYNVTKNMHGKKTHTQSLCLFLRRNTRICCKSGHWLCKAPIIIIINVNVNIINIVCHCKIHYTFLGSFLAICSPCLSGLLKLAAAAATRTNYAFCHQLVSNCPPILHLAPNEEKKTRTQIEQRRQ